MDKSIFEKAMDMPANERVALAEMILASIDFEEETIRQAWIKEVKERILAVKKGESELLDFEGIYDQG